MAIRTSYLAAALGLLLAAAMPLAAHAQPQGPDLKKGQQRSAPAKPQGRPAVRPAPHVAPRPAMRAPAPHVAPRPAMRSPAPHVAPRPAMRAPAPRPAMRAPAPRVAPHPAMRAPAPRPQAMPAATSTSAGRDTALGAAACAYADTTEGAIHAATAATTAARDQTPATTRGARIAPAGGAGIACIAVGPTRATA